MQQVGFTAVGTVLVEMSIEEWDKIAPESEVVILESPYDDNALAKFLEVIFGERVSIIDVLEKKHGWCFFIKNDYGSW